MLNSGPNDHKGNQEGKQESKVQEAREGARALEKEAQSILSALRRGAQVVVAANKQIGGSAASDKLNDLYHDVRRGLRVLHSSVDQVRREFEGTDAQEITDKIYNFGLTVDMVQKQVQTDHERGIAAQGGGLFQKRQGGQALGERLPRTIEQIERLVTEIGRVG